MSRYNLSHGLFSKQPHITHNGFPIAIIRVIIANQSKLFMCLGTAAPKIWKNIYHGQGISRSCDHKEAPDISWVGVR